MMNLINAFVHVPLDIIAGEKKSSISLRYDYSCHQMMENSAKYSCECCRHVHLLQLLAKEHISLERLSVWSKTR